MILLGRMIDANDACELGLFSYVAPIASSSKGDERVGKTSRAFILVSGDDTEALVWGRPRPFDSASKFREFYLNDLMKTRTRKIALSFQG